MEDQQTNILINLRSRILSEALQRLLEQDAAYETVVAHNLDKDAGYVPDKILVDVASLEEPFPPCWENAKIILIDTGLAEDEVIRLLLAHRLDGVISTCSGTDLFHKALQTIEAGQIWLDNEKVKALIYNPVLSSKPGGVENLSRKEKEIVRLVAEGHRNREIAAHLNMSVQTVKTHLSRIFKKSNVTSRAQLVPLALTFKP